MLVQETSEPARLARLSYSRVNILEMSDCGKTIKIGLRFSSVAACQVGAIIVRASGSMGGACSLDNEASLPIY